ncbi:class I SAM-dependent methyltransferase [Sporolactobacillus spathodeae]|uniref:16S rRNA (Guanine1207-N2)-methyltransferase n=1 Tax=Sporolactobacillus spathodeae TaxID=1465502 RepID=A0ABS2Q9X3_9BACL|nr:class I SAM-dependent methyltransferase [Sporolactobacillus spathodeae]MBM7658559.1 16S rRNA (guanine1207-N2)-methyltransferase [Sporolactobacillus spathodeae]
MNEHYYTEHPQSASDRQSFKTELKGTSLAFVTDAGVFSKSSVDFGSRLLIETFREPEIDGPILDMGCGYGPIGISLGKCYKTRKIIMADINERAVQLAAENARKNQVNADVLQSFLFEKITGDFASIVSNPPIRAGKKVVHQIFSESFRFLKSGGTFWTVVQKKQGAPSAFAALEEIFDAVEVAERKKGYHIFCAKKL